jgi:hypothetical protein
VRREIAELVFRAHAEGLGGIELRPDAHPLAVLSLALVTVPRTEPSGSTIPGIVQAGAAPEKKMALSSEGQLAIG